MAVHAGVQAQSFTYDAAGNITCKTGVGSITSCTPSSTNLYAYPQQGATLQQATAAIRPHAVSSIPGVGSFTYDNDGNMLTGAGRSISWTSFDMPLSMSQGSNSSLFAYGPEHQRTRQTRGDNSIIAYAGSMEIVQQANGSSTLKTYWPDGVGVEIDTLASANSTTPPSTSLNWVHTDNLGSVVAVTDSNGNLEESTAYDAWGARRDLAGDSAQLTNYQEVVDNKGYTGQEMLDQLNLVHLNGRVYDPLLGKFISGDPLIADPTNGQNYNRYAYVLNNPTNEVDPTGFADTKVEPATSIDTLKSAFANGATSATVTMNGATYTITPNSDGYNVATSSSGSTGTAAEKGNGNPGKGKNVVASGKSPEEAAYLKRYNDYLKAGGGGSDSPNSLMQGFDDNEHATGHMSDEEYHDINNAKGTVGSVAVGVGATVLAAPAVIEAGTSLAIRLTPQALIVDGTVIYGSQNVLSKPGVIEEVKQAMQFGLYRFSDLAGRIGGEITEEGEYVIGEGHHRMAAAFKIFQETGNSEFVQKLIQYGRFFPGTTLPVQSFPEIPPGP